MSDLCPTCGIRLTEGLCQCPEVLLAEIERLRTLFARVAEINLATGCCHCGLRGPTVRLVEWSPERSAQVSAEIREHDARCPANPALQMVRSLRAKLMRERARVHEQASWVLAESDVEYRRLAAASLAARARRLRAKADRFERGGR